MTHAERPRLVADPERTLRHGLVLARVDVTRTVRATRDRIAAVLGYVLVVGPGVLGGGYAGYLFGRDVGLAGVSGLSLLGVARGALAVGWVGLSVMVAVRTVSKRGELDNHAGLLSRVPTRTVVVGRILAETAVVLAWVLPVTVAAAGGYGLGAGEWHLLATAPVAVGLGTTSAVAVGTPVGLAARHVLTRFEPVARYRRWVVALVFAVYVGAIVTESFGDVVSALYEPLRATPLAWTADVLLLAGGVGASPVRAGLALPLTAAAVVGGAALTTLVASRHWFADPVLASGDETSAETDAAEVGGPLAAVERSLSGVVGRGTAAVVVLAWRRAARAPTKLIYLAYPLLGGIGAVGDVVQTGTVPPSLPAVALVFVAWAGTAAFTLNPLGDQGSALPTTVLSPLGGRRFVAGHVLAGVVVAAPLGTALVVALALAADLGTRLVVGLAVGTPLVVVLGSLFAVGVGVAVPRYETVSVTRSTEAVVPSLVAFLVQTVYLLTAAGAGAVVYEPALEAPLAALVSWLLPFGLSTSAATVGTAAVVVVGVVVVAPLPAAWYAVRRVERVTVD